MLGPPLGDKEVDSLLQKALSLLRVDPLLEKQLSLLSFH